MRTERRKPRRVGAGTKVDADGLREYAILPCVHGCGAELAMLSDGKQKIQVIEDHLAECARLDAADRPAKKARGGVSVKTLADPAKAALVPMLHAKCQQDLAAVRAELTAQIDELRGTQLAMLSAFATAWPLLKQHEPLKPDCRSPQPSRSRITSEQHAYPFLDPKLVVESIYEGPGGSKAHLEVVNGAIT